MGALRRVDSPAGAPQRSPSVIDSWLVDDGKVRGLELHERRFLAACVALLPELDESTICAFFACLRKALPRTGRWFPRVEAHRPLHPSPAGPSSRSPVPLQLWLREAPDSRDTMTLPLHGVLDPRLSPRIKGADLTALAKLREHAQREGADDALLIARDGSVLETAHSALIWWRGRKLCLPAAQDALLPSVTCALLVELAKEEEVAIEAESVTVAELQALEVWSVNALHGIRPVTRWCEDGGEWPGRVCSTKVADWRARLAALRLPVEAHDAGDTARIDALDVGDAPPAAAHLLRR
jgi:branched-subunit amino acid aminotransferase/4-amino-4-deoxychorismate lyase